MELGNEPIEALARLGLLIRGAAKPRSSGPGYKAPLEWRHLLFDVRFENADRCNTATSSKIGW